MAPSVLKPNEIYQGVVLRRRGKVYDVHIEEKGVTLTSCVLVSGVALALLGVKMKFILPAGTRVAVLGTQPGQILHTIPSDNPDPGSGLLSRLTTGDVPAPGAEDENFDNFELTRTPSDMVEGEFMIENDLGVGLAILTSLARLSASDRAKIECFAANDHVRIISNTFHHMSAFGDMRVVNDNGRITVVDEGTSHDHEAWGQLDEKDPKAQVQDYKVSEVATTGRWRFSSYVGFLGDFLHQFYTDPVSMVGALAQDRAGKLRVWHGGDGTYLVSSVADIVLERVTRIPVPMQNFTQEDAAGDTDPSAQFLDTWRHDPEKPWVSAFQLRDYARWLNQYHAYASFLRMKKDWTVKSEAECPTPAYQAADAEAVRRTAEQDQTPRDVYACYRIMRDGSIVSLDGYGGVVMQAGGSIIVSAPKDVRLEAGRNLVLAAGNDIYCKARRHVEIVAVTGAFLAKARTRLAAFCERGTVLLRTLMQAGQPEETQPATHRFNNHALGVVIDAPKSGMLVSAGGQMSLDGGHDETQEERGVEIRSTKGDITMSASADKTVRVGAGKFVINTGLFSLVARTLASIRADYLSLCNAMVYERGKMFARNLYAQGLFGLRIVHGTPMNGTPPPGATRTAPAHTNHVGYTDETDIFTFPDPHERQTEAQDETGLTRPAAENVLATQARVVSEYLPRAEYGEDALPQSLAQQIAEQDTPHPTAGEFEAWDFSQDGEQGDANASHKLPWPGTNARMERYQRISTEPLGVKSQEAADSHTPNRSQAPEKTLWRFMRWRS